MMLPSKKVLSVFIVMAALVAAIIITFGRDTASSAINYTSNLVAGEKVKVPENPNWQNELGGAVQNIEPIQAEESASIPGTVTDTLTTSFMANYLALKQSGTLDSASAQKLIDQTVNYVDQTSAQANTITELGLNVVADNGKQSIMDYGENLGNILRNNKPKEAKNELEIMTQIIESKDQSKINELDSIIAVYEKISGELIKMPVPKTFVEAHLAMINGINNITVSLKEMKVVFTDPFKGLSALGLYQNGATIFVRAMQATSTFIKQNDIVYKQGSGGYYLLYGI